jgi:hypothetical protein
MGLLLTEAEFEALEAFFEDLSSLQLDMKGEVSSSDNRTRRVRRVRRDLRGVPSDTQLNLVYSHSYDTIPEAREYARTNSVRRQIRKRYLQELRGIVVEERKRRLTLAQAHEYITTFPMISPQLNRIRIRDLRRKNILTDADLDALIRLFQECKAMLDEKTEPLAELNHPNGERYFLVRGSAFP